MVDQQVTLEWVPPGPGTWVCERNHTRSTQTVALQAFFPQAMEAGFRSCTARYGLPISHLAIRYVNGYAYGQMQIAGAPARAAGSAPPPRPILFLLTRLLPEMRRRAKAAEETLAIRRWRADADRWFESGRDARIQANLALQDEDVESMGDAALADHIDRATANAVSGLTEHFSHIALQVPIGEFLIAALAWQIPLGDATLLLGGASPATTAAAESIRRVAEAVAAAGVTPTSLDDIRAASPEASEAITDHLRWYGWRIVTASDLTGRTLIEMPDVLVRMVNRALSNTPEPAADVEATRARVPAAEREHFDELLAEARLAYRVREDDVTIGGSWTVGLLRRSLLAAAHRLVASGWLADPEHIFDLRTDEVAARLRGEPAPSATEVTSRVAERHAAQAATPPLHLGPPPSPPPSPDAFPAAMARLTRAMFTVVELLGRQPDQASANGTGVGTTRYRGRACVAADAADAIERLQPGDVLVTQVTTPAFNGIIPLAGALVTEEGGLLSHPAIAAREHGITAVVGAAGVVERIPDGAIVEVDPSNGTVEVVS